MFRANNKNKRDFIKNNHDYLFFFVVFLNKRNKNQLIVHLTREVEIKNKEMYLKLKINEIKRNTLQHSDEMLNNSKDEILRD